MADTMEAFRGGSNQLSNLHVCPDSCEIHDQGTTFPSSEHHYQFKKLRHHSLGEEAYLLLTEENSFKAMCKVNDLFPDDKISEDWKEWAVEEMKESNQLKYSSCEHTKCTLMASALTLVEATGDLFWGSGLNVQQTKECLQEYWPGQNQMGTMLMVVHDELQTAEEQECKCKAESPLSSEPKLSKT